VGISGFTVRPAEARRDKPRVSAFTNADLDRIVALKPDLVVGFSDIQAGIAKDLAELGIEVYLFNQRSIAGILDTVARVGSLVGAADEAAALIRRLEAGLEAVREEGRSLPRRPRVYFEEWDEPQISCIRWVSELIEVAGGVDCFPELSTAPLARGRVIADPQEVPRRRPDVIVASWCGKKFRPDRLRARPGWDDTPALRSGCLYEIDSSEILQPGPAALTDGVRRLLEVFQDWARRVAS
jgi:iron complex transport system substrate-binding protein